MAERSEAKSAKRSFPSKIKTRKILTRCCAQPFLAKIKRPTNWSLNPQINPCGEISVKIFRIFNFDAKLRFAQKVSDHSFFLREDFLEISKIDLFNPFFLSGGAPCRCGGKVRAAPASRSIDRWTPFRAIWRSAARAARPSTSAPVRSPTPPPPGRSPTPPTWSGTGAATKSFWSRFWRQRRMRRLLGATRSTLQVDFS